MVERLWNSKSEDQDLHPGFLLTSHVVLSKLLSAVASIIYHRNGDKVIARENCMKKLVVK